MFYADLTGGLSPFVQCFTHLPERAALGAFCFSAFPGLAWAMRTWSAVETENFGDDGVSLATTDIMVIDGDRWWWWW